MKNDTLWFTSPAQSWLQCLPVGNGHIGCMLAGDPACDVIGLNDDSLWSGYRRDYHKQDFRENIEAVRALILQGERAAAEQIAEERLTSRFTQAYLPLGDLIVRMEKANISDYRRALELSSGIVFSHYRRDGVRVSTESFASFPDDVFVHHIVCETARALEIGFACKLRHEAVFDDEGFIATGIAPSDLIIADVGHFASDANRLTYDEPERSMRFAVRMQVVTDGAVTVRRDGLLIEHAMHTLLVLSSATSFSKGESYLDYANNTARDAAKRGIDALKRDHIKDHAALYARVRLNLGEEESNASCPERLARMRRGAAQNADLALLFQFGRYLLIASSRPGTQAANLQGIWNRDLIPPWWSGYTLNINLQMNYWLADRTDLGACFAPLTEFVQRLCEAGEQTARENYGAQGAVAHHQSDIWAHTTPVGLDRERIPLAARWMMWNMPLPWLALQLYDHEAFSPDADFLRETLYPVMKSAADFMKSTFTRVDGKLYNIPSTSPENMYRDGTGRTLALCTMSAMDIGIAKEFSLAYADVCERLGRQEESADWYQFAWDVPDYSVSPDGLLREWDGDFEQTEPGHRHFSMLFGVYPGSSLLGSRQEPAARKALEQRLENGSGQTGWSAVWAALLLARFGEGDAAYDCIQRLLREHIHDNLFGAHPPQLFQIDANLGLTAAICELLLQETGGVVRLLPALPKEMASGSLEGVRVHGGHRLSFGWKDGILQWLEIEAARDGAITLAAESPPLSKVPGVANGVLCVLLQKGNTYRF